jgi:hypothetical protein
LTGQTPRRLSAAPERLSLMTKVIQAKGKIRRKERVEAAQEEADLAQELVEKTPVRKMGDSRYSHFPTRELRNVMADTFERVWEVLFPGLQWQSEHHRRVNAEDLALSMIRLVKYGIPEGEPVKISEQEFQLRYCEEHR